MIAIVLRLAVEGSMWTPKKTMVRAFPRLSTAIDGRVRILGHDISAQVVDLSRDGCKALPLSLDVVLDMGLRPGADIIVEIGGTALAARLAWATPNCSGLGCDFLEALGMTALEAIAPFRVNGVHAT